MRRWRDDGEPIPLEHTQGPTWMIWLQTFGIMQTIGFDAWDFGREDVEEEPLEDDD